MRGGCRVGRARTAASTAAARTAMRSSFIVARKAALRCFTLAAGRRQGGQGRGGDGPGALHRTRPPRTAPASGDASRAPPRPCRPGCRAARAPPWRSSRRRGGQGALRPSPARDQGPHMRAPGLELPFCAAHQSQRVMIHPRTPGTGHGAAVEAADGRQRLCAGRRGLPCAVRSVLAIQSPPPHTHRCQPRGRHGVLPVRQRRHAPLDSKTAVSRIR